MWGRSGADSVSVSGPIPGRSLMWGRCGVDLGSIRCLHACVPARACVPVRVCTLASMSGSTSRGPIAVDVGPICGRGRLWAASGSLRGRSGLNRSCNHRKMLHPLSPAQSTTPPRRPRAPAQRAPPLRPRTPSQRAGARLFSRRPHARPAHSGGGRSAAAARLLRGRALRFTALGSGRRGGGVA